MTSAAKWAKYTRPNTPNILPKPHSTAGHTVFFFRQPTIFISIEQDKQKFVQYSSAGRISLGISFMQGQARGDQ